MLRPRLLFLAAALALVAGCGGSHSTAPVPAPGGPTQPPVLLDINGATQPSGTIGSTVILEGSHFGATQGASVVQFAGAAGPIAAMITSPGDWTDGFIVTTVPSGTVTGPVRVITAVDTSGSLPFEITSNAAFSPSTITWTAATSLPAPRSGHAALYGAFGSLGTTRCVFVLGGRDDSAPRSTVWRADVLAGGALGAWQAEASLPAATAFHAAALATPRNSRVTAPGFLYVLGGIRDTSGTAVSTAWRGSLDSTGTVTGWSAEPSLPVPLRSFGAAIVRGDLYVAGGAETGNAPSGAVYRARIQPDGTLGAWAMVAGLPSGRAGHALDAFGTHLYVLGGESDTTSADSAAAPGRTAEILDAAVDMRTGVLGAWTSNASGLTKAVSKHTGVVAGGNVLATAGIYNGASAGSTEESYAQIMPDGSVGSFLGATGSHTITSAGGKDLFNHAAVVVIDAAGTAHVLVLGGDDINAPGTRRAEVWLY